MKLGQYDQTDPQSIEAYGQGMIGKTFHDLYNAAMDQGLIREAPAEYATKHASKKFKGGMGTLVEECYFGYAANRAVFPYEHEGYCCYLFPEQHRILQDSCAKAGIAALCADAV